MTYIFTPDSQDFMATKDGAYMKRLGAGGELGLWQNTHTPTKGIGKVFSSSGKCSCPWPFFSIYSTQTTPS
jgi:hypothetical protein